MSIPWRWWVISIWMNRNQPSTWECWGELTTSWLFSIEEHWGRLQGGTIHWVWVVHWRWFYFGSSPTISSRRYISYRMPSTMLSLNQDLPISCSTWEALDPWWRSNRSQWCLLSVDRWIVEPISRNQRCAQSFQIGVGITALPSRRMNLRDHRMPTA